MISPILNKLGILPVNHGTSTGSLHFSEKLAIQKEIFSPVDGKLIAAVNHTTPAEYEKLILAASKAFEAWRLVPAPKRGEIIRQYGNVLREYKSELGTLVS
ncbi:MAG: aldehyde dehydrogenase family protein, partial [Bacteroidota bacterium]